MLTVVLVLYLGLTSSFALAASDEAPGLVVGETSGEPPTASLQEQLDGYLNDDDIAGATAFLGRLADHDDVTDDVLRGLENRLWRIRSERIVDYSRTIREAIRGGDLEAMRAFQQRLQRLMPALSEDEIKTAKVTTPTDGANGAGGPKESIPSPVVAARTSPASSDDPTVDQADPGTNESITELMRLGDAAFASNYFTIAPEGRMSALAVVDRMMTFGVEGEAAAQLLALRVMDRYRSLAEREISRRLFDRARTFTDRMATIAERADLSLDPVGTLRERIDNQQATP